MFIKQTCNHVHVFCYDFNAVKNMWNNFYSIVKSFFTLFFFRYEIKCDFFYEKGLKFSISEWIHEKLWIWGTTHWQATSYEFTKFSLIHTWIQKIMYLGSKKRMTKMAHTIHVWICMWLCRWITWIYMNIHEFTFMNIHEFTYSEFIYEFIHDFEIKYHDHILQDLM